MLNVVKKSEMDCPTKQCPLPKIAECPLHVCPHVDKCPHLYEGCDNYVDDVDWFDDYDDEDTFEECDLDLGAPRRGGGGASLPRRSGIPAPRLVRTTPPPMRRSMPALGRGGRGQRWIVPPEMRRTPVFQGARWYPRLYGGNWWLWRQRWFAPFYQRYAPIWYPAYWTPLYIYNDANVYVRNPELPVQLVMPTMPLPCFEADLSLLRYDRDSLTSGEEAQVEATLEAINQQLQMLRAQLQYNPSYVYWTNRGFVIVPDLDRGCFVWAYARRSATSLIEFSKKKPSHGGVDVAKDVAKLVNERILFDVYSERTPYTGFFISQDGDVYSYVIDFKGEGDARSRTTFVDRIDSATVSLNDIDRLKDMLRAAKNARVDHFRHDTGDRKYWGFLGNERMFIYGDGNSHSSEADALVKEIDRILFPDEQSPLYGKSV